MQWPMVLVVSVDNWKVRSVSRQKVRVYEGSYAKFDPTLGGEVQPKHEEIHGVGDAIPDHVLSIKILSDHTRNADMNEPLVSGVDDNNVYTQPDPHQHQNAVPEQQHQGEEDLHVPEHSSVDEMQFLSMLEKLRDNATQLNAGTGVRDSIVKAIKHIHDNSMGYPTQGSLKVNKWKDNGKVSTENILTAKRDHSMMSTAPVKTKHEKKSKVKKTLAKKKTAMQKGTRVKVRTTRFDGK